MGICDSNNKPQMNLEINNGENLENQNINPNIVFPGIGTHIPDEHLAEIANQKEKSICKIIINKKDKGPGFGTGFLCEIRKITKNIKTLITAYHVLGEDDLKIGNEIKFAFNDDKIIKIIKIDGPRLIYASKEDDITIIEILDSDKLNDYDGLEIDKNIYNGIYYDYYNFYNEYNYKTTIYILHYPEGNIINFSKNFIVDVDENDYIYHLCETDAGSSGSPILNLNTLKVIGIHQGNGLFDKEKFHNETKEKYQQYFNKENKLLCNAGKILKEPIIKFLKNKISLTLEVNKIDIEKKIYFLQDECKCKSLHKKDYNHKLIIEIIENSVIIINDIKYESKEYFVPKTVGIYHIKIFIKNNIQDCSFLFTFCRNIIDIDLSSFDTKNVINMRSMFEHCKSLKSIHLSSFDTKNVTDMGWMFYDCESLESIDLSSFDTKNVTDIGWMFYECKSLKNIDLSSFDTKNVTDMRSMFEHCKSLKSINLSSFDTKNVTDMNWMFCDCKSLESINLSSFDTKNVTNIGGMFYDCESLKSIDLSSFDTKNVTNMRSLFEGCKSLKSIDLSSFDTKNVTNMRSMFEGCVKLKNSSNFHYNKNDYKILNELIKI